MRRFTQAACVAATLLAALGCQTAPAPDGYAPVAENALTPAQQAQQQDMLAARDALFAKLSGRLMQAIQNEGTPAAIAICQEAAPAIAAEVGAEHGVDIGRTSWRVRNPENAPPAWTEPYIDARRDTPVYLAQPDGGLAALLPIKMQALCVQCHGPQEQIAPEVQSALAEAYPADEAVGFNEGDLRGWFHITAPPQ